MAKTLRKQLDEANARIKQLEQQLAARQPAAQPRTYGGTGCGRQASSRQPAMH